MSLKTKEEEDEDDEEDKEKVGKGEPDCFAKTPGSHAKHSLMPSSSAYVPGSQGAISVKLSVGTWPAGELSHSKAPWPSWNLPASHVLQGPAEHSSS